MTTTNGSLPPDVLEALEQGHTIEAIKRLRAATGLGLKEAKDLIDAHKRGRAFTVPAAAPPAAGPRLAPGEVPRSGNTALWLLVVIVAAVAAYYVGRASVS